MRTPSKRTIAIVAAVTVVAGGAVGGALAASGTFDPAQQRQAFLNDAAGRLGVTSSKLEDALKAAAIDRIDAALAAGQITQPQADAMKAAVNAGKLPVGPGLGFGFGHRGGALGFGLHGTLDSAATYLGLTDAQLLSQLSSGKSLADIAKAQGKSVAGLEAAIVSAAQSKLDQAVQDGRLTSAERDQILTALKARIDALVNRTPSASPPAGAFGDRFHFAPGGFRTPFPAESPGATPTA
jgi:hypothetical protein